MSWNVLITSRAFTEAGPSAMQLLREAGCELVLPPKFGPHRGTDLVRLLAGMDAVLATLDPFTAETFNSASPSSLKIISRWGVGFDSIDIPAATRAGVIVAYTPGLLDETVADFAWALILALARRVHEASFALREGHWQQFWGSDVFGKTLGLIGCGRIGQAVARRAGGFNMRLLAYDPRPAPEAERLGVRFVSLAELLAESDFVSLHAAVTAENRGLIGPTQLRMMRAGAFLINTARGALLDEMALGRALQEGWIAGAALDTFAIEPLAADHPLRHAPNLLLTPHQASYTRQTGERVSLCAAQAILDLIKGRRPQFVVNPAVFASPALRADLRADSR